MILLLILEFLLLVTILDNIIKNTKNYGIQDYSGTSNVTIYENEILNSSYGIYFYKGTNYNIYTNNITNSSTAESTHM